MEDTMRQKLDKIREIMDKAKETTKDKKLLSAGHSVGILSTLEGKDIDWLRRIIGSECFQGRVNTLHVVNLTQIKAKTLEKNLAEFTFCLYVSNEREWTQEASASKKVKSLSAQGKKNLVVVIQDVNFPSNENKTRTLEKHPDVRKYSLDLFLFSRMEMEMDIQRSFSNPPQLKPEIDTRGSQAVISPQVVTGHKVGIFSRSAERDFSWLMTLLMSEPFRDHVLSVRPCYISNNGYQKLNEDLSLCTFGILYHTKTKGRVNITDVTDGLYDLEIQQMSMRLGKKNLIVMIDDLENTSDEERSRILHTQPKISAYANDLLLISYQDKADNMGRSAQSKILHHFLRSSGYSPGYPPVNPAYEDRGAIGHPSVERRSPPPYRDPPALLASVMGPTRPPPSRATIGIFSRSEEGDYAWLRRLLTSEDFGSRNVLCHKISDYDKEAIRETAYKSKFGILYHSVRNGKIRLTDTGSMYHEELEKLSFKLGKKRLMVVIDDLDDSRDKLKQKLMEKQPSLSKLVVEIFLFTVTEKKEVEQQNQGKDGSKMRKSTSEKLNGIKKILT